MLVDFFYHLRAQKLLVSVKEYLTLLEALSSPIMPPTLEDFYFLSRTTLIKDETLFDRFDRAFATYYRSLEQKLPPGKKIPLCNMERGVKFPFPSPCKTNPFNASYLPTETSVP